MRIKPNPGPAFVAFVTVKPSLLRVPVVAIDFYPRTPSEQRRSDGRGAPA